MPLITRTRGANDRIRVAIIGLRGKGNQHMKMFNMMHGVEVAALCDPDKHILAQRANELNQPATTTHTDLREVMDDKAIDAVVVATPNHWHALATIWACQAGKDVYVEKPVSYTLHESRLMITAARKYKRMVQSGIQRRSDMALKQVLTELREGELGEMKRIRVIHYSPRGTIGRVKAAQAVPPHIDYNLWCGPAPRAPLMRRNLHYDWHWVWDTGNGELGNNGPHELDLARWAAGYDTLAPGVTSIGGRFGWNDDGETPNTQIVYYDYQPVPIMIEVRNLPTQKDMRAGDHYKGLRTGIIVECEGGYFSGMDGGHLYDNKGKKLRQIVGDGGRNHQANFIRAMRDRKIGSLNADITEGHLSCGLCHQGNISHVLGETMSMDELRAANKDESLDRMATHLEANEIDLDSNQVTVGPHLKFDTTRERFLDNDLANQRMNRAYRKPFSLPMDL